MKINGITEYFEKIEIYEKYKEYFCNVSESITMKYLWIKKYSSDTPVFSKQQSKRIFKEGVQNQSHTLLIVFLLNGFTHLCPKNKRYNNFT